MKSFPAILITVVSITFIANANPQSMNSRNGPAIKVHHLKSDFSVAELGNEAWDQAADVPVKNYWSGEAAPVDRHFNVRLLWSDSGLYVRFDANQNEPLIVNEKSDLTKKAAGLWDRDVCEIFIAPIAAQRNRYFEFEIAPTGEWIDLALEVKPGGRKTDIGYSSGMQSAAMIGKDKVVMAIKIPWKAFGYTPKVGSHWLGNLFRCVGKDPTRGYLSWQATKTAKPSFHVPKAFGTFEFVK